MSFPLCLSPSFLSIEQVKACVCVYMYIYKDSQIHRNEVSVLISHPLTISSFPRCCCGRLMAEHSWQESLPPISFFPGSGQDIEEDWSIELHTKASPTDAYGTVDFEDTATRVCRAKVCVFQSK